MILIPELLIESYHSSLRSVARRPGGDRLAARPAADVAAGLLRHQLHQRGRALLDLRPAPLRRRLPGRLAAVHPARRRGPGAAVADPPAHAGLDPRPGSARPAPAITPAGGVH